MAIITISRGSFSKGREVAVKVAQRLHYASVSREVIIKASQEFNIPEIKLAKAIHDAPSFLERFTFGRERYLAHIESTILEYFRKDNVVYHGLAGHFFVKDVPHVLKVRIIADLEDRIVEEMVRQNISREQAQEQLRDDDYERRQWSLKLYGMDNSDPKLYDLVLHIHKLTVADAVEIICHTVKLACFQTTPESQQALENLALAAKVKARIVRKYPAASVTAQEGKVLVHLQAAGILEPAVEAEVKDLTGEISGVKEIKVHLIPLSLI
ncbi:MAG: cytidylate kinase-like family protein [Deltaproteobacteria bacterium]|jgi:cytidylate kinase